MHLDYLKRVQPLVLRNRTLPFGRIVPFANRICHRMQQSTHPMPYWCRNLVIDSNLPAQMQLDLVDLRKVKGDDIGQMRSKISRGGCHGCYHDLLLSRQCWPCCISAECTENSRPALCRGNRQSSRYPSIVNRQPQRTTVPQPIPPPLLVQPIFRLFSSVTGMTREKSHTSQTQDLPTDIAKFHLVFTLEASYACDHNNDRVP